MVDSSNSSKQPLGNTPSSSNPSNTPSTSQPKSSPVITGSYINKQGDVVNYAVGGDINKINSESNTSVLPQGNTGSYTVTTGSGETVQRVNTPQGIIDINTKTGTITTQEVPGGGSNPNAKPIVVDTSKGPVTVYASGSFSTPPVKTQDQPFTPQGPVIVNAQGLPIASATPNALLNRPPQLMSFPSREFLLTQFFGSPATQQSTPTLKTPYASIPGQYKLPINYGPTSFLESIDRRFYSKELESNPVLNPNFEKEFGLGAIPVAITVETYKVIVGTGKLVYNTFNAEIQSPLGFPKTILGEVGNFASDLNAQAKSIVFTGKTVTSKSGTFNILTQEVQDVGQRFGSVPGAFGFVGSFIIGGEVLGEAGKVVIKPVVKVADFLNPYYVDFTDLAFKEVGRGIVEGGLVKTIFPEFTNNVEILKPPSYVASLFEENPGTGVFNKNVQEAVKYYSESPPGTSPVKATVQYYFSEPQGTGIITQGFNNFKQEFSTFEPVKPSETPNPSYLASGLTDYTVNVKGSFIEGFKRDYLVNVKGELSVYKDYLLAEPQGKGVLGILKTELYEIPGNKDVLLLKDYPSQASDVQTQLKQLGTTQILVHASPSELPYKFNPITGRALIEIDVGKAEANPSTPRGFAVGTEKALFTSLEDLRSGEAQAYIYYITREAGLYEALSGEARIKLSGKPSLNVFNENIPGLPEEYYSKILKLKSGQLSLNEISPEFVEKAKNVNQELGGKFPLENLALYYELDVKLAELSKSQGGGATIGIAALTGIRGELEATLLGTYEFNPTTLRGKLGKITGQGSRYTRLPSGLRVEINEFTRVVKQPSNIELPKTPLIQGVSNTFNEEAFTGKLNPTEEAKPVYNISERTPKYALAVSSNGKTVSTNQLFESDLSNVSDISRVSNISNASNKSSVSLASSTSGQKSLVSLNSLISGISDISGPSIKSSTSKANVSVGYPSLSEDLSTGPSFKSPSSSIVYPSYFIENFEDLSDLGIQGQKQKIRGGISKGRSKKISLREEPFPDLLNVTLSEYYFGKTGVPSLKTRKKEFYGNSFLGEVRTKTEIKKGFRIRGNY